MRIIKHLAEQIQEEVTGAEEYAKDALEHRLTDPELSKLYIELAKTEYNHVQRLHEQIIRKIEEAKKSAIEPPESMLNTWDEKHKKLIEQMAKAKTFIEMYK